MMLTLPDREGISHGLTEGLLYTEIGLRIGRDPSVVSREVTRHGGRSGYRPAYQCARISVVSITWNVLFAIRSPSHQGRRAQKRLTKVDHQASASRTVSATSLFLGRLATDGYLLAPASGTEGRPT